MDDLVFDSEEVDRVFFFFSRLDRELILRYDLALNLCLFFCSALVLYREEPFVATGA